jgi:hypothetical protein
MTIGHPARNAATPSNILPFMQPGRLLDASYDRVLTRQEAELREAFAKIQALRRHHDEIIQLNGSRVGALFAAHDAAVCRIASLTSRRKLNGKGRPHEPCGV